MTASTDLPAPKTDARGGALDLLRFLAAGFIVLYHFGSEAPTPLADISPAFGLGWLATDFFLILSGYVLGRAYGAALDERRTTHPSFFARRLARVWPGHIVALMVMLVSVAVATAVGAAPHTPERFRIIEFFDQAALIHAWGVTQQASWNEPSWSLSALIVCYAVFPLIWWLCQPLKGRAGALVVGLAVLLGAAALSLGAIGLSLYDLPFHYGVVRALPLFILGMMLARFAGGVRCGPWASRLAAAVAVLSLIGLQMAGRSEATAFGSIVAIGLIVLSADGIRLPGRSITRAAADLSFALFITHDVTGSVWFGVTSRLGLAQNWLAFALSFPFALACAAMFHRMIDQPIQDWLKRVMARKPAPVAVTEAA